MRSVPNDLHYLVLREQVSISTNSSGYFDFSRSANALEGYINYSSSVTAIFEEVRVDWFKMSWYPCANVKYGTALSCLPVVTATYAGADNNTHSYSGIGLLQDVKIHTYDCPVVEMWKMPRDSSDSLRFYNTTGTGTAHQIPDLGGILAFMTYTWSGAAQVLGFFSAEYGLTLKGFKQ